MTLRPEYSLGHSQYNEFLFTTVDVEAKGEMLTVLSALARLDVDPWQEAARLSDLPRDVAATSLASTLARLPSMGRNIADAAAIAARLVAILPAASTPAIPPTPEARPHRGASRASGPPLAGRPITPMLKSWLFWAGLAGAAFLFFQLLQTDHNLEPANKPATDQQ